PPHPRRPRPTPISRFRRRAAVRSAGRRRLTPLAPPPAPGAMALLRHPPRRAWISRLHRPATAPRRPPRTSRPTRMVRSTPPPGPLPPTRLPTALPMPTTTVLTHRQARLGPVVPLRRLGSTPIRPAHPRA